ncbi:MAG: carbohydrate kinase, partial [Sutterella sp.]
GDTEDVKGTLAANIVRDAEYHPDPALTARYRRLFDMRNTLVRSDMKAAFSRLVKMRDVE